MTTTLLGKVVITPRGAYNSATAYVALDAITYQGSSFLVLEPVTGVTPVDDGVHYQLLAQVGATGAAGTNGTNGINGAQQLNGVVVHAAASYTALASDAGVDNGLNWATAATFVIPNDTTLVLPVGALLPFSQYGAGIVTATAGDGTVTVEGFNGVATSGVQDFRVAEKIAANTWRVL